MTQYSLTLPEPPPEAGPWIVNTATDPARALVDGWPNWTGPWAALFGPESVGKSHLAYDWAERANAQLLTPVALSHAAIENSVLDLGVLSSLPQNFEEPLFHFLNNTRQAQATVLITSRISPARWPVQLPDLASRLRSILAVELAEVADPDFLDQFMLMQLAARQCTISASALVALGRSLPRNQAAYLSFVDWLTPDTRTINVHLVNDYAGKLEGQPAKGQGELF